MSDDSKPRFDLGDIVRLRADEPDLGLKAGDCGVVWVAYEGVKGIFEGDPIFYEADFIGGDGPRCAHMFRDDDVERVVRPEDTPFPERVEEYRRWLLRVMS